VIARGRPCPPVGLEIRVTMSRSHLGGYRDRRTWDTEAIPLPGPHRHEGRRQVDGLVAERNNRTAVCRQVMPITALIVAVLVWPGQRANAAEPPVSLSVTPDEIALPLHGSSTGELIVSNTGAPTGPVSVRIQPRATDGSVVVTMESRAATIPKGGAVPFGYTVVRSSEGAGQDITLWFLVRYSYSRSTAGSSGDPPRAVIATSKVKAAAYPKLVEATVEGSVDTINENRSGEGALVIANPREAPITIRALHVSAPSGVRVIVRCPMGGEMTVKAATPDTLSGCVSMVAPRSKQVLGLRFEAESAVSPGKRTVFFTIDAADPQNASPQSVTATSTFTVDVFAESEILKALGVPAFLLLPGVIIFLTAWGLIFYASPWRNTTLAKKDPPSLTAATTAAIAGVFLSLVVAGLYPALTSVWPGHERNYLKAYGFRDFYYVFVWSFFIAILAWLVAILFFELARLLLFVTWAEDDARSMLRKLSVRGHPRFLVSKIRGKTPPTDAEFPKVALGPDDGKEEGLLLTQRRQKAFLAPRITFQIDADALEDEDRKHAASVKGRIEGERNRVLLWRAVRKALREPVGPTKWTATVSFSPNYIASTQVVEKGTLRPGSRQTVPLVEIPEEGE
jgi:hypothetical protein